MTVIAHPLPEGTVVRSASGEWEVEDYVTAEEAEDGVAFYYGSNDGGYNNVDCPAAEVLEVIRTAEEQRNRKVPTPEEIARHLDVLRDHDLFDCDETEPDGTAVQCYGVTPDGLRVAVRLRVEAVDRVDW